MNTDTLAVDALFSQVRRYSKMYRLNREDVDDIVGGVVIDLLGKRIPLDNPLAGAYTYWHIRRFVSRRGKIPQNPAMRPRSLAALSRHETPTVTPADLTERAEAILAVKEAMLLLQPRQRQAIELFLEDMDSHESAVVMGCKPHTVAVYRCHGINAMKKILMGNRIH